ncbi:hypothetical protein B0H10DRAFT_2337679 [Mycena sp. CBHHK59/15]|nr:hypothetical protein B0H10DRAFT_2337679 [Mycena sp. CBHHK59/15]
MSDSERKYVDLIFRACQKYASWDPEVVVRVGDWGRITRGKRGLAFWRKNGTFLKEGNIYEDGKANKYEIPAPIEHSGGSTEAETWVVSQNAEQVDVSTSVGGNPAIERFKVKRAFKFSSGRGAVLAMENDTISKIDPLGALRRLLEDNSMRDIVIVSEVHRCSAYARLLTTHANNTVALGLSVEPPVSGLASTTTNATWVLSTASGYFRSQVNKSGERDFYPLFRLVSLTDGAVSTGLGGELDDEAVPALSAAEPPSDAILSTHTFSTRRFFHSFFCLA